MLSRVAAQLYWMSRYLERAENMARILEVGQSKTPRAAANPRPTRRFLNGSKNAPTCFAA